MTPPRPNPAKRLIRTIVIDLVVLGVFLGAFSYFHFLREREYEPRVLSSPPQPTATATPDGAAVVQTDVPSSQGASTPAPEPIDTGLLGGKYAEKFTSGEIEQTENSYRSANV